VARIILQILNTIQLIVLLTFQFDKAHNRHVDALMQENEKKNQNEEIFNGMMFTKIGQLLSTILMLVILREDEWTHV
jgi:hypothetical protein